MTTSSTPLTHFSLFSGIGGLDLAAEWAGFQTVGQVELKEYPYKVLCQHWPDVPKWRDIKDVTSESIRRAGIAQSPTVLSGGFPCQPFSTAGQRRGAEDDRFLWPEMLRVVQELRPSWIVGENVAGIINMALDDVCSDLESAGYSCRAFVIPAAATGAPHLRQRVFVVANTGGGTGGSEGSTACTLGEDARSWCDALCSSLRQPTGKPSEDVADSESERREKISLSVFGGGPLKTDPDIEWGGTTPANPAGVRLKARSERERRGAEEKRRLPEPISRDGLRQWVCEPGMDRVVDGAPDWVDRVEALGNAVVPQQVYPIFQAIAEVEKMVENNNVR